MALLLFFLNRWSCSHHGPRSCRTPHRWLHADVVDINHRTGGGFGPLTDDEVFDGQLSQGRSFGELDLRFCAHPHHASRASLSCLHGHLRCRRRRRRTQRAGRGRATWPGPARVPVLERLDHVGGAAVSAQAFDGVDARLSRYSYLVSLLPASIIDDLGARVRLARRRYSSYTPDPTDGGRTGLLIGPRPQLAAVGAAAPTRPDSTSSTGAAAAVTEPLWPTMIEPLRSRSSDAAVGAAAARRRRPCGGRSSSAPSARPSPTPSPTIWCAA